MSKKQKTKKVKTNNKSDTKLLSIFCRVCGGDLYENATERWCGKCTWKQPRGKK